MRPFSYRCGQLCSMCMMSGPAPDWMAAAMRGCMSLALMNSKTTSAPRALEASPACRLSSTSHAGMKSTHRRMFRRVPWAQGGARPAARLPSVPAAAAKPDAAPVCRKARRLTAGRPSPPCSGVVIDSSFGLSGPCRSGFVDLLQLAFRPGYRVLGLRALHGLGVHVGDDVLGEHLGGLGSGGPRVPEDARVAPRLPEHL